jgi:hypothetical protein
VALAQASNVSVVKVSIVSVTDSDEANRRSVLANNGSISVNSEISVKDAPHASAVGIKLSSEGVDLRSYGLPQGFIVSIVTKVTQIDASNQSLANISILMVSLSLAVGFAGFNSFFFAIVIYFLFLVKLNFIKRFQKTFG